MKKMWKWIVAAIVILLVVIFSVMNTRYVRLDFWFKSLHLPLIYIVLGAFILGGLVTMLLWLTSNFEHRHNIKALQKDLDELQSSLDDRVATEVSASRIEYDAQLSEKEQELVALKKEFAADSNEKNKQIQQLQAEVASLTSPLVDEVTPVSDELNDIQ
ncbi:LapA family protein [Vagococcus xieshaowenii]|uniref:DUF1049 domain-containing protein n=1 Tax=Vagococcus xieshaowenii TaxID=2562451 RepID=A0AAJ5EEW9_9ENTE|nr:lipopolysaccharide assembly protein LapA domain-containing protein [Vagococcus xieshaowenii]QCA28678.1 DUF1049 domain-containing protein [Vagococcus xieshaowenii]TFZ40514.1 DUF1049 domain-containing protein [Vagococcus xieshaowenii]